MNTSSTILIYGANGFSAGLILNEFLKMGIKPILAGRNSEKIKVLAHQKGCNFKIFDLNSIRKIISELTGVNTVLNCAGPFSKTAAPLINACLISGTNYIDITGEMEIFKYAWSMDTKAKEKGIVILPGAGFDVIPTDCLAKKLKEELPDASSLKLAFATRNSRPSRGTIKATLDYISSNTMVRKGEVISIPTASLSRIIDFGDFHSDSIAVQWADVFNAYFSTEIDDIEIYMALPSLAKNVLKMTAGLIERLLSIRMIKKMVTLFIDNFLTDPNDRQRQNSVTYFWGMVQNQKGTVLEKVLQLPDGYNITAFGAAEAAFRISQGLVKPGTQTPSLAFGSDFIELFLSIK
jgi:short subunit dehydrogenase-like uncharacterized protein